MISKQGSSTDMRCCLTRDGPNYAQGRSTRSAKKAEGDGAWVGGARLPHYLVRRACGNALTLAGLGNRVETRRHVGERRDRQGEDGGEGETHRLLLCPSPTVQRDA